MSAGRTPFLSSLAAFGLAAACAAPSPAGIPLTEQRPTRPGGATLAELKVPVYLWEQSLGPCGAELAMDGDGDVWSEGGCENGPKRFARDQRMTEDQQRAIREAFAALPPAGKECGWDDRFVLITAPSPPTTWYVCDRQGHHPNPLETDGLPPPFERAARALKR